MPSPLHTSNTSSCRVTAHVNGMAKASKRAQKNWLDGELGPALRSGGVLGVVPFVGWQLPGSSASMPRDQP